MITNEKIKDFYGEKEEKHSSDLISKSSDFYKVNVN